MLLVTGDGLKTPGPVAERVAPVEIDADADALLEQLGSRGITLLNFTFYSATGSLGRCMNASPLSRRTLLAAAEICRSAAASGAIVPCGARAADAAHRLPARRRDRP